MKSIIRNILKQIFCVIFALTPNIQAAHAAEELLEFDLEPLEYLARAQLLVDYSQVRTHAEFVAKFAGKRPAAEKAEILRRISKLPRLPKVEAIENGILISLDSLSLRVDMRGMAKGRYIVNGQVVTASPNNSWTIQADILLDKLQNPRPIRSSSILRLLIPEAQAVLPAWILVGGTMVGMAFFNNATGNVVGAVYNIAGWYVCDKVKDLRQGKMPANPYICAEYKREMEALNKKTPANEAVKNALAEGSKNEKYATGNEVCPYQVNGKHYHGVVTVVATEDDPQKGKVSKGEDKVVRLYALVNGDKLGSASVYRDDNINGKINSELLATFAVDGQSVLEEIVLPDTKKTKLAEPAKGKKSGADKKSVEDLTIRLKATADLKDQPEMQAQQAFYQGLFKHLGDRLRLCKIKADEKEAARLAEPPPAEPVSPKKETKKGTKKEKGIR